MNTGPTSEQLVVCQEQGVEPDPPRSHQKLGISRDFSPSAYPINGLRHPAEHGTCGWYVWSGEEFSDDPDFFEPIHVNHLDHRCPDVLPFLALPPGWRFLFAPNQIDVWYDESLLDV